MRKTWIQQVERCSIVCALLVCLTPTRLVSAEGVRSTEREQVGEIFGQPVFRDEIRTGKAVKESDEVQRLFLAPLRKEYRQKYKAEIEPTADEIKTATEFFEKEHRRRIENESPNLQDELKEIERQLDEDELSKELRQQLQRRQRSLKNQLTPPGQFFAVFMLRSWKLQKHLYEQYDGGRILWQQAGVEAFDATRKWLESCELRGDFKITDEKLRAAFYRYWTTKDHGHFLTDDKEKIREELLEPEWAPKSSDAK